MRDDAKAFTVVANEIEAFVETLELDGRLKAEADHLATALGDVVEMVDLMLGWQDAASDHPQDALAQGAGSGDTDFYAGKVAVAHFFAATVLPELAARRQVLEETDNTLMDIADGAF